MAFSSRFLCLCFVVTSRELPEFSKPVLLCSFPSFPFLSGVSIESEGMLDILQVPR